MLTKIKDLLKSKKKEDAVDLEWDAASQAGKGIPDQELPAYTPAAFEVPTEGKSVQ